ncbi:unnamed protein product [Caenorhabditis bovis]|uniref:C2H2-type domain-containing protein n=1 Tax=Caenorhabditis bovis TaxID=2654633 RepID=A0A8S1EU10_9PELO|nr:unnamed protein product [Caenorhabditis bovis]
MNRIVRALARLNVKRNFNRVSLLQRLEDHPYIFDGNVQDIPQSSSRQLSPYFNLSEYERNRLLDVINGSHLAPSASPVKHDVVKVPSPPQTGPHQQQLQQQHPQQHHQQPQPPPPPPPQHHHHHHQPHQPQHQHPQQQHSHQEQHQPPHQLEMPPTQRHLSPTLMPPMTSAESFSSEFMYSLSSIKPESSNSEASSSFDCTINSVAHAQIDDMFSTPDNPSGSNGSSSGGSGRQIMRRKGSRRSESCKANCKICGHDVMYSPQRTWNLMRHVWIMHQSTKPNQCSMCGYAHIKPYVRKHIEAMHKDQNATIIDLKSPELEAEWSALLDQCFGVTYRKWKHHKEEAHQAMNGSNYRNEHFTSEDMQQKFVVVEVSSTPTTMTLVEYLVTHGFDKFAVVTDLCDHPSLKYKDGSASPESPSTTVSTAAQHTPPRTAISTPTSMTTPVPPATKPRASIDSIANALSKKSSPPQTTEKNVNGGTNLTAPQISQMNLSLTRLLEEQQKICQVRKEQERQQAEIQRIILSQANSFNTFNGLEAFMNHEKSRETPDFETSETISKASSEDLKTEQTDNSGTGSNFENDFGLGPSDEQVRASMMHLLNPAFGSAFGFIDDSFLNAASSATNNTTPSGKRKNADGSAPATKKHRWLPVDELEESRSARGKNCGRVHCKATYKCALCGKPTTLNSTGSRWNLLRHVIMIHSDCKPYKCWDCDFTGIKSNVISHARQCRHRADDAHDITTDEMRAEWNALLHECFPDYVRAKERGWQPEETPSVNATPEKKIEPTIPSLADIQKLAECQNVKIEC